MVILCSALVGIKVGGLYSQGGSDSFSKPHKPYWIYTPPQPQIKLVTLTEIRFLRKGEGMRERKKNPVIIKDFPSFPLYLAEAVTNIH